MLKPKSRACSSHNPRADSQGLSPHPTQRAGAFPLATAQGPSQGVIPEVRAKLHWDGRYRLFRECLMPILWCHNKVDLSELGTKATPCFTKSPKYLDPAQNGRTLVLLMNHGRAVENTPPPGLSWSHRKVWCYQCWWQLQTALALTLMGGLSLGPGLPPSQCGCVDCQGHEHPGSVRAREVEAALLALEVTWHHLSWTQQSQVA